MHSKVEQMLTQAGVSYQVHHHSDCATPIRSPRDFAAALGYDIARITKTLLLRSTEQNIFSVVVLSCHRKIKLDKVAELMQTKRVQMATPEALDSILNYPKTGVSPMGISSVPIFTDAALLEYPTVLVGAGQAAVEIEIAPHDLVNTTGAKVVSIAV